jgi:hypothetical protein
MYVLVCNQDMVTFTLFLEGGVLCVKKFLFF